MAGERKGLCMMLENRGIVVVGLFIWKKNLWIKKNVVLLQSLFGTRGSFGRGVRHRSAKPATPVQIRKRPRRITATVMLPFFFCYKGVDGGDGVNGFDGFNGGNVNNRCCDLFFLCIFAKKLQAICDVFYRLCYLFSALSPLSGVATTRGGLTV